LTAFALLQPVNGWLENLLAAAATPAQTHAVLLLLGFVQNSELNRTTVLPALSEVAPQRRQRRLLFSSGNADAGFLSAEP